jgi:hypothetical protein
MMHSCEGLWFMFLACVCSALRCLLACVRFVAHSCGDRLRGIHSGAKHSIIQVSMAACYLWHRTIFDLSLRCVLFQDELDKLKTRRSCPTLRSRTETTRCVSALY